MTKKELIEDLKEYPDNTPIGLMFESGDTCDVYIESFTYANGRLDTRIIVLRPR